MPYQGAWRPFIFEHDGQRVTDRVLVVWSDGKQRLDQQKRRTYLKRLLNGLDVVQKKLNSGRDKKQVYVEQRLLTLQRADRIGLVDVHLSGSDGTLALRFAINRPDLSGRPRRWMAAMPWRPMARS